ncbi:MAG: biotin--[acetyl-CoA-carboxylase] ligase [Fibrobacteraceae bacterium]|nr:biotin--[acetyl-CoA-carboxylase] ligase [Fibrobacteraceae bacterium]
MFTSENPILSWQASGFGGAVSEFFESVESTHSLMKEKALRGDAQPGALIVADHQTAGRGRHQRTWSSPAGKNLYFNILVPLENIAPANYAQITQVTALTFAEVFRSLQGEKSPCKKISVKWPNDILFEKSKFCGILAEIIFSPTPALNLGVGINVNSNASDYNHLGRNVTSLKEIVGKRINREKLLQTLVASLERAIGQFKAFGISPWVEAWRKMDKFIGARGTIIANNHCTDQALLHPEESQKKSGHIIDMKPDGSLLFKTDDGETINVFSADLEI